MMRHRKPGILVIAALSIAAAGCDPYDCSPRTCENGTEYQSCLSCSGDVTLYCTIQTRTPEPEGEEIAECDYESDPLDNAPRDACFAKVEAAACSE